MLDDRWLRKEDDAEPTGIHKNREYLIPWAAPLTERDRRKVNKAIKARGSHHLHARRKFKVPSNLRAS